MNHEKAGEDIVENNGVEIELKKKRKKSPSKQDKLRTAQDMQG